MAEEIDVQALIERNGKLAAQVGELTAEVQLLRSLIRNLAVAVNALFDEENMRTWR